MRCTSFQNVSGTVLVADDQASNRELMTELLSLEGFEVIAVADGVEALAAVTCVQPDLILLDVLMPRMSGLEACAKLKANPETFLIPVVLTTSLTAKEDRISGIQIGADDFLSRPIDRTELVARVRSLIKLKQRTDELERAESVLFTLARSIEGKDPYTHGHCERLSDYSARLGERMALPAEQITALRRGGIVHDIGKIMVPDSILLKPSRLSKEEWALMREHPVLGEKICAPLKSFRMVLPIIRHHHEKRDGSGYPDGLSGDAIPLTARILQIIDVYDALTTERPYKRAMPVTETLATMKAEVLKGWWDEQVFHEFERMVSEGAIGDQRRTAAGGR